MMTENINNALRQFKNKRILVAGDVMLDIYTHGEVTRISPEAPVLIVKKTRDHFTLGGAANVAQNLAVLGAEVVLVGLLGKVASAGVSLDLWSASLCRFGITPSHQNKGLRCHADHFFNRFDQHYKKVIRYQ